MSDLYGDDIITITDEDGKEYVLEVLAVLELDGTDYYALVPAEADDDEDLEVSILKAVEEDGEEILCAIEDEDELERVYGIMMDEIFKEDEEENTEE